VQERVFEVKKIIILIIASLSSVAYAAQMNIDASQEAQTLKAKEEKARERAVDIIHELSNSSRDMGFQDTSSKVNELKKLVMEYPKILETTPSGHRLLNLAINRKLNHRAIEALVGESENLDALDTSFGNKTALMEVMTMLAVSDNYADKNNAEKIIELLVAAGANPDFKNQASNNMNAREKLVGMTDHRGLVYAFDAAVRAGLAKRKSYAERKQRAHAMLREYHAPDLANIISGYAYSNNPECLPQSEPDCVLQ